MAESYTFKVNYESSQANYAYAPQRILARNFYKLGLEVSLKMVEFRYVPEKNDQYDQGYRQALKDVAEILQREYDSNCEKT